MEHAKCIAAVVAVGVVTWYISKNRYSKIQTEVLEDAVYEAYEHGKNVTFGPAFDEGYSRGVDDSGVLLLKEETPEEEDQEEPDAEVVNLFDQPVPTISELGFELLTPDDVKAVALERSIVTLSYYRGDKAMVFDVESSPESAMAGTDRSLTPELDTIVDLVEFEELAEDSPRLYLSSEYLGVIFVIECRDGASG